MGSTPKTVGNFFFGLEVSPRGLRPCSGVLAEVQLNPWRRRQEEVKLHVKVTLVNWLNSQDGVTRSFTRMLSEYQDFVVLDMLQYSDLTQAKGWLSQDGALRLRARCWF